ALCYAGFESQLEGAEIAYGTVCLSGNFLTSRGPGTAIDFSLKIVEVLKSREISEALASSLLYTNG
ncbi:MAG: DJ-1 family protein, partial [Oscillospiraceae bacterium]|nr:DJ-1 family protein [Oscillospiraceae bacterium]